MTTTAHPAATRGTGSTATRTPVPSPARGAAAGTARPVGRLGRLGQVTGWIALSAVGLLVVARLLLDVGFAPVLTGSMAPSFSAGDAVVTKMKAAGDVGIGDVVLVPAPGDTLRTAHRVVSITDGSVPVIATRGDSNPVNDTWTTPLRGPVPYVVFSVPAVGSLVHHLTGAAGVGVLVALLLLLAVSAAVNRTADHSSGGAPTTAVPVPRKVRPMTRFSVRRLRGWQLYTAAGTGVGALAIIGAGVLAALNAEAFNATDQTVTSGTLKLTLGDNGVGFTQNINDVAPGDVVNRYVDLTNGGTLEAKDLKLKVENTAAASKLSTDAVKGLAVKVEKCTGGTWTATTGVCSGTASDVLATTALANLGATPGLVDAGPIAAGAVVNLKLSVTLPDQVETVTNGALPADTIQGLTAKLKYTFTEEQRTATTTNS